MSHAFGLVNYQSVAGTGLFSPWTLRETGKPR